VAAAVSVRWRGVARVSSGDATLQVDVDDRAHVRGARVLRSRVGAIIRARHGPNWVQLDGHRRPPLASPSRLALYLLPRHALAAAAEQRVRFQ
jgi:hypothetical protein